MFCHVLSCISYANVDSTYFHGTIGTLAFGGVGDSGQGAYRGKASFDTFTHRRPYTKTPGWAESLIAVRYPPYFGKMEKAKSMSTLKPNFDRDGKPTQSFLSLILGLGAKGLLSGLTRWLVVLLSAIGVKRLLEHQAKL
jgi:beta-apo-4'-carotenal oxygenase